MQARLDFFASPVASKVMKHLVAAGRANADGTVSATTLELVKVRASQINGCALCLDMHTKEAIEAGETQLRLNLVATWREATVFTEPERAALELAELGTRLADRPDPVTDDAWANAAKHYDDDELAAIVCAVALINAWNRANVMVRQPGGDYQPGMFG